MGMATASKKHWTIDMVRALPDDRNRYEIIDAELFVTPAPSLRHQAAVLELAHRLLPYIKAQGLGRAIIAPADVEVAPDTMVEPDLFVVPPVAGRLPRSWTEAGRLLLVVEVLSPTTARVDRVRKRALYARMAVPEYWIVDVDARVVERWRPDDERPEVLSEQLDWRPDAAQPALTIDLAEYFAEVTGEALGATE
jgi:Uma2 family endonuclease